MSDSARGLVWDALLDADYAARYYGYLANKLARREQLLAGAVILLSSGALAVLIAPLQSSVGPGGQPDKINIGSLIAQGLSLVTALIGVYLFSSRPGRIALLCAWEAHRWARCCWNSRSCGGKSMT